MDFVSMIWNVLAGSVFNIHTYVGIALGAMFTPLWVSLYNFAVSELETKVPDAKPVVTEVTDAVNTVVDEVNVAANVVENNPAVVAAQPK
jgi:hypothetical protein